MKIVLDFSLGAVGFLINGAQRAGGKGKGESEKGRIGDYEWGQRGLTVFDAEAWM